MFGLDKAALRIVSILSGIALICVLCFGLAFCHQRDKAQKARGEAAVATSQANLGKDASNITAGVVEAEKGLSEVERQNREDINNATNANESAGDAGNRGLRALCRRVQYASDPRCAGLR